MLLRRYSSFLHISSVLTWNMILLEAKYHFKKVIFIGTIFLWNVFLFWVIWFTYSSDKMSTLDTIVKRLWQEHRVEGLSKASFWISTWQERRSFGYYFWDYFWDVYRDREPARTDNSVWEVGEKEVNIVKGARFCYCRIYHKFVNFIILNLFNVVKWKSCFILLRGISNAT